MEEEEGRQPAPPPEEQEEEEDEEVSKERAPLPEEDLEEEEGGEQLAPPRVPPLSPPFPVRPRTGRPGPHVAAAPRAYRPSSSGLGVSAEGPPAPPALSPEARRLRLRGRGCFWAASSGSMARRGGGGGAVAGCPGDPLGRAPRPTTSVRRAVPVRRAPPPPPPSSGV